MPKSYRDLLKAFQALGAPDPESWAKSEAEEDIPQLATYVFLRRAWEDCVIREDDPAWTNLKDSPLHLAPKEATDDPCGGFAPALKRLADKGIDPKDLIEVVRVMQYQSLFQLCYLLYDNGDPNPAIGDVCWGLFETDAEGEPLRTMAEVHESVLGMDPTGREMRPRKA